MYCTRDFIDNISEMMFKRNCMFYQIEWISVNLQLENNFKTRGMLHTHISIKSHVCFVIDIMEVDIHNFIRYKYLYKKINSNIGLQQVVLAK